MFTHTKEFKSHKIFQINDAILSIQGENKVYKQEAKKKMEELERFIMVCKENKGKI